MYIKKLQKVILIVFIAALISAIAGFWIFEFDWPFLSFPLFAGLAIVLIQKERISYKFIDKLIIGSLLYGFTALLLIYLRRYLLIPDFPFWPFYDPQEYLISSLVFSYTCLLGGLAGIVIKGFYFIFKSSHSN